jgi:hypothetical protein
MCIHVNIIIWQASSALLIYYCEKASDLTTSDPSLREVIVELLMMKPSHIKNQDGRDGKTPLVVMTKGKMCETGTLHSSQHVRRETLARRDDKRQDADGKSPLVVITEKSRHETRMPRFVIKCGRLSRLSI